jgi:TPR repeat protein
MSFKHFTLVTSFIIITSMEATVSSINCTDHELEGQTINKKHKSSQNQLIDVLDQDERVFQIAVKNYAEKAKAGDTDALYQLSLAHLEHLNDEYGYIKAHALLTMAARKKHVLSAYQIAVLYEQGLGIERNQQMAILGYSIAASHGLDLALYKLALIHLENRHEVESYEKALDLLRKAARQKNKDAMRMLEQLEAEIWDSLDLTL